MEQKGLKMSKTNEALRILANLEATNAEKNLANIQSSLHHAWSIMLIYKIK